MKQRRTIVITMGEPKGIGPEVIIKALASEDIHHLLSEFNFLVIGASDILSQTAKTLKITFNPVLLKESALPPQDEDNIFLFEPATASRCPALAGIRGAPNPLRRSPYDSSESIGQGIGADGLDYILAGIEAMSARGGKSSPAAALVTAPVSKASIRQSGCDFIGHTELLAQKTLSRKVTMMFAAPQLKVALVTTHIAYKKVLLYLTADKIFSTIEQTDNGLRKYFKVAQPRIAICGLNPHAGEGKAFGNEESRIIEPAIKLARERKINCSGPAPADSIFHRAIKGEFDAVVALYHDQGLIPIKTLAFSEAVQVTLGLPFIRTSPAHGVAYDIAGKGMANPTSMIEAIKLAVSMGNSATADLLLA